MDQPSEPTIESLQAEIQELKDFIVYQQDKIVDLRETVDRLQDKSHFSRETDIALLQKALEGEEMLHRFCRDNRFKELVHMRRLETRVMELENQLRDKVEKPKE